MNGFWLFMTIVTLLIPMSMIIFGYRFTKKPPRKINLLHGYRTKRAMQNQETWHFAHRYVGKLWWIIGIIMFSLSLITMLAVVNADENLVALLALMVVLFQMIGMISPIYFTEEALKKHFD